MGLLPPMSQPQATITGAAGDNALTGTTLADNIDGLGGNDTIEGLDGRDTLNGGAGNDLISDFLDNAVNGGDGDDRIVNFLVQGGTWDGGAGRDTIDFSNDIFDATINLAAASFLIQGATFLNFENVLGSQGNETITGNAAANLLDGQSGNDTLNGGAGYDTLNGGAGNDLITDSGGNIVNGGDGDDTIVNTAVSGGSWNGGLGSDTIDFTSNNFGAITIDLRADLLVINGAGFRSFENVRGGAGNETIYGTAGANVLVGGLGADTLIGGLGNDSYYVDRAADQVIEALNAGIDTVVSYVDYRLTDNLENLALGGSGNQSGFGNAGANSLTGNVGNNRLSGEAGADLLRGGAGNDTLIGGAGLDSMLGAAGDDTYFVDGANEANTIAEDAGAGTDTVVAVSNWTLGANFENLRIEGFARYEGTGNGLSNIITGSDYSNMIKGLDGDDTLIGLRGYDELYGGAGNDRLEGGADSDLLNGGSGIDTLIGGSGDDRYVLDSPLDQVIELAGEGRDQVSANFSYALGQNVEDLILSGSGLTASGNEFANSIRINGDNARILAGEGDNTIVAGGIGAVIEAGNGADQINVSANGATSVNAGGGNNTITVALLDFSTSLPLSIVAGAGNDNIIITGAFRGAAGTIQAGTGSDIITLRTTAQIDFVYTSVADSTGVTRDVIAGSNVLAFGRFDLPFLPTGIDAKITTGSLSTATFNADLAAAVGPSRLAAGHAVLFDPSGGDLDLVSPLNTDVLFVVVDANGIAGYQADQDYVIQLSDPPFQFQLTLDDFT